jgi:hypothetical protein
MIRGLVYVPGIASALLRKGTLHPDAIALVDMTEALEPRMLPSAFIIVDGKSLSHAIIKLVSREIPAVLINR